MVTLGPQFHKQKTYLQDGDRTYLLHHPVAPIYHGSPNTEFKVGDILDAEGPHDHESGGLVYGTNNPFWAEMYANKHEKEGRVYRVVPIGRLNTYVDEQVAEGFADPRNGHIEGTVEHSAPRWRIIGIGTHF